MDHGPDPIPTTERYVYEVPSDRNPRIKYRVDLTANGGAGECQCTDFATRKQPNLKAGKQSLTPDTTCKHLRKTHTYFLRSVLKQLARQEDSTR